MTDVKIGFTEEHSSKTKDEKSALLEKEIDAFSSYMEKLDNKWFQGRLIPQERVLLKTYLVWKLSGKDVT